MGNTFMEPMSAGFIITLISAAVLRRKAPMELGALPRNTDPRDQEADA